MYCNLYYILHGINNLIVKLFKILYTINILIQLKIMYFYHVIKIIEHHEFYINYIQFKFYTI